MLVFRKTLEKDSFQRPSIKNLFNEEIIQKTMKEFTETQGNNIKQFDMTQSEENEKNEEEQNFFFKIPQNKNEQSIKKTLQKDDFMGSTIQSQDLNEFSKKGQTLNEFSKKDQTLNEFSKKDQATKTIKKTINFTPLQKKVK